VPVLSARGISKAFGTRVLFSALDVTIRRGERVGLLGVNGAGKSTLLRILAGLDAPDEGTVERRREARVLYLSQEPALDQTKTAQEIVEAAEHEGHVAAEMLDRVGIADKQKRVSEMSGGEKRRVALAALLVAKPDLAILDEPTNHLDADTIEWLEDYLASQRGALLMVTHDRYVLDTVCDRILELANERLYEYEGSYGDYLEKKAEREAHEERVEKNRQNLLRREKAWLLRGAKARTTKQKARIKRALAVMAQAGPAAREDLDIAVTSAPRLGKTVLELHDLVLELGGRTLVRDLTLHLRGGERIGIVGPNGSGKTTLLRAVTGELAPKSGTIVRGTQTKIAMLDQGRRELRDDWTIVENVVDREGAHRTGAGVVTFGDETVEVRTYLERFLFDSHKQMQKVGALSGGERARVTLAKVLTQGANLLLLDEPTNDLDVSTLSALESMLDSWPGAALVVSHDRWFLDRAATSILAFEGDGRCVLYPGNFSQYRDLREAAATQKSAASSPPPTTTATTTATSTTTTSPTEKPLTYAERIELDGIMDVIAKAEDEVTRLEKELLDPSFYATRAKEAGKMNDALAAAKAEVTRLTERWESLESRRALKK
jgi:ATP-binding cassette subfamily F protein uup